MPTTSAVSRHWCPAMGARVYGPAREHMPCVVRGAGRRRRVTPRRPRTSNSGDGDPRTHARAHRLFRSRRALLWRHALQRGLRPPVRGHPRADARLARPPRRAAGRRPGVLWPRIHASNLRFAAESNPTTTTSQCAGSRPGRSASATKSRCRPVSGGNDASIRSCAVARRRCALRPNAMPGARCRRRSTCSPKSAPGKTDSAEAR